MVNAGDHGLLVFFQKARAGQRELGGYSEFPDSAFTRS